MKKSGIATWASTGAVILAPMLVSNPARAADLTPTEIVTRHTSSGGDIDKIMADYADDAVVLQQGKAFQGKPAIRALFEKMFPKRPEGAASPARPAGGGMKVTKMWEEGNVGFLTWTAGPINATEEFIVKGGKIQVQTIFMTNSAAPAAAAPPGPPPAP